MTALKGAQSRIARQAGKFKRGLLQSGLERHVELVDWSSPESRLRILEAEFAQASGAFEKIPSCMKKYFDGFVGKGDINRHSHILIQTFLAAHNFLYSDKATMAVSVETRLPFMDVELMQLAAHIPESCQIKGGKTKHILKKAMEQYLPKEVLMRDKTGFGPPLRRWLARGLDEVINEFLSPARLKARAIFQPDEVQRVLKENRQNKIDHAYLIYALLSLELWQQTFIDHPGVELRL